MLASRPEGREAQRALARDITTRTHGAEAAASAEQRAASVFGAGLVQLGPDEFASAVAELPRVTLAVEPSWTAAGTAVASGAAASNGEARRLVSQGGLYINDERVTDPNAPLPEPLHGRYWVVRTGKKNTESSSAPEDRAMSPPVACALHAPNSGLGLRYRPSGPPQGTR